jgi:hypothetical protein
MNDFRWHASFFGGLFLFLVVLLGGTMAFSYYTGERTCAARWEQSGLESSFGLWQGCLVKVQGRWLPASTIREVELRK